jgi:hypothetical protein
MCYFEDKLETTKYMLKRNEMYIPLMPREFNKIGDLYLAIYGKDLIEDIYQELELSEEDSDIVHQIMKNEDWCTAYFSTILDLVFDIPEFRQNAKDELNALIDDVKTDGIDLFD